MDMKPPIITVIVQRTTRDALKQLGMKGETYDSIIRALIRLKDPKQLKE